MARAWGNKGAPEFTVKNNSYRKIWSISSEGEDGKDRAAFQSGFAKSVSVLDVDLPSQ